MACYTPMRPPRCESHLTVTVTFHNQLCSMSHTASQAGMWLALRSASSQTTYSHDDSIGSTHLHTNHAFKLLIASLQASCNEQAGCVQSAVLSTILYTHTPCVTHPDLPPLEQVPS